MKVTQKRLNKLNSDKMSEISNLGFKNTYLAKEAAKNKASTKLDKVDRASAVDLKALFQEMDSLYSVYGNR